MNPNDPQPDPPDLPPEESPAATMELPAALVDALRELDGPAVLPSAEHDDALLAGARAHLAQIAASTQGGPRQTGGSRHILAFLGAGGAIAAAAAVTLVVWINGNNTEHDAGPAVASNQAHEVDADADSRRPTDAGPADQNPADETDTFPGTIARPGTPPGARPGALAGDLDGSGALDILDAFALARAIEHDGPAARSRASDFNRDGTVDQQDADWLAERAVALSREGGRG